MQSALDDVGRISDSELVGRLKQLVKADRVLTAKLLVHLGEVEARRLHLERGYSSMFDYCRTALGMSEAEAHLRILAAGIGRRFPRVLERLGAGALHLTAIRLLAPHLTPDNHVQLLDRVRGMTKRQIEVLVADLAPKPDVPARIRKVPEPRKLFEPIAAAATVPARCSTTLTANVPTGAQPFAASDNTMLSTRALAAAQPLAASGSSPPPISAPPAAPLLAAPTSAAARPLAPAAPSASPSTFELQSPRPRATSTPLGLGRFKLQLTLGQEAQNALEQLVELLRHQNPSGDLACIVERALVELLKNKLKQRFGKTNKSESRTTCESAPAGSDGKSRDESRDVESKTESKLHSPNSRHIPVAVRRELHARDGGQCTFVSDDGRRCTERGFMEVHHHNTTFARGGKATADNLRLVCRAHNRLFAEHDYGRDFMQAKLREAMERRKRPNHYVQALTSATR